MLVELGRYDGRTLSMAPTSLENERAGAPSSSSCLLTLTTTSRRPSVDRPMSRREQRAVEQSETVSSIHDSILTERYRQLDACRHATDRHAPIWKHNGDTHIIMRPSNYNWTQCWQCVSRLFDVEFIELRWVMTNDLIITCGALRAARVPYGNMEPSTPHSFETF